METDTHNHRKFSLYIVLNGLTILCGILSRSPHIPLPWIVSTYAGDVLWALMVFWCFCLVVPRRESWELVLFSILFSFSIEFSQFYHAPWIDSLRQTTLGGLVLGFGFKSSDLVCYWVGILFGAIVDVSLQKLRHGRRP